MLVEHGFRVVSTDSSDQLLKNAIQQRWNRRKEPAFDQWGKQAHIPFSRINPEFMQ